MSKKEQLERQLEAYNNATNALINGVEDAGKRNPTVKASMWDAVVPLIRAHVLEVCEKDVRYDARLLADRVLEKVLPAVLGDDFKTHLDAIREV